MNTLAKAFIVINLLLGVAFLSVSSVLFAQQEAWKGKYNDLADKLSGQTKEYSDKITKANEWLREREKTITDMKRTQARMQTDLEAAKAERDLVREEFRSLKKLYEGFDETLTKHKVDFKNLLTDLNSARQRLATVEAALEGATKREIAKGEEVVRLTEDIADMEREKKTLSAKIDAQDKEVTRMARIIAKWQEMYPSVTVTLGKPVPPPIDAMVQAVDPRNGIVILSVGAEDQVRKGFTFYIYRDTSYIGEVEVEKVLPGNCSARINEKMTRAPIRAGDGAKTRLGTL